MLNNSKNNILWKYKKYFLEEWEWNASDVKKYFDGLYDRVFSKFQEWNQALMKKNDNQSLRYIDSIKDETFPEKGLNIDEVLEKTSKAFWWALRRHSTQTAYNVWPSPILPTVGVNAVVNLFNPNCLMDEVCWDFMVTEKKVVKFLSDIAWIDYNKSDWMSTYWWAWTLMYAIKTSLWKVSSTSFSQWIRNDYYVLTWESNHYFITNICWFLWIWTDQCIRIPSIDHGIMDLVELRSVYESLLKEDKKVICIIANWWETINHAIDDLSEITKIIDNLTKIYESNRPHLHLDSVNWRCWLTFQWYDFEENQLKINEIDLSKIRKAYTLLSKVYLADSFSADFHKTWLCPYTSAFYLVKNFEDLKHIQWIESYKKDISRWEGINLKTSIEHSRSWTWILSAYVSILTMWKEWFQAYLSTLFNSWRNIKNVILNKYPDKIEIVNKLWNRFVNIIVLKFFNNQPEFEDLCRSSDEIKLKYNQFARWYYEFCLSKVREWNSMYPYLWYISNYTHLGEKTWLVTFKIYGMSVNYTNKDYTYFVKSVVHSLNEYKKTMAKWSNRKTMLTKEKRHTLK